MCTRVFSDIFRIVAINFIDIDKRIKKRNNIADVTILFFRR